MASDLLQHVLELDGLQVYLQIIEIGGAMEFSHRHYIKEFDPIAFMICFEPVHHENQLDPFEFLDLYLLKIYPDYNFDSPYGGYYAEKYYSNVGEKKDVPIEIVCTKFDLKNEVDFIPNDEILNHVENLNINHYDFITIISNSSKTGFNVKKSFENLIYCVWEKYGKPKFLMKGIPSYFDDIVFKFN
jgi:hypothetical protein